MKLFYKLNDILFFFEKIIVGILVAVMSLSLIFGVIFRYFLNSPLMWSDEVSMFCFIWISFVGGSMALKTDQFAAVSIFTDRFRERTAAILIGVGTVLVFAFCVCLMIISIKWIGSPLITGQRSTAIAMPMIIPYLSVPVGITFMTLHALEIILKNFQSLRTKKTLTE